MKYLLVFALLLLPGCAVPVLLVSGTSIGVNETTGKTITDHVVSGVNGKDCRIARTFRGDDICKEEVAELKITESKYKPSSVADIEKRYNYGR